MQRDGFSDTHATGNQQRPQQDVHGASDIRDVKPEDTVAPNESPTPSKKATSFLSDEIKEVYVCDGTVLEEVLSADAGGMSGEPDMILAIVTQCRIPRVDAR